MIRSGDVAAQSITPMDSLFMLPDSVRPFTIENFYNLVVRNHPVARQAKLLSENARLEMRMARGNFDPKLDMEISSKNYGGKQYYSTASGSINFPSLIPLDPTVGVEQNTGPYLNPERWISDEFNQRQIYAGLSVPLGRGLITDERRTALRQAELFGNLTKAEQVSQINKLLLDASMEYWQWYYAYYNYRLLNRSVAIAADILRIVKFNYEFGEAAPIDTVQATITWQQRVVQYREARLEYQNIGLGLSNFLWDSLGNPTALDMGWAPVQPAEPWAMTRDGLLDLIRQSKISHPQLRKLNVKIRQLELDRQMASEYLKPELNLSYYFLNQPFDPRGNASLTVGRDYKLGVDFSFPLFLRKERARLGLARLKILNTRYDLTIAEREILNEMEISYNQLINLQSVIGLQRTIGENYERLLASEILNLEQGESDLFKINLQQEKLIDAQTRWLKAIAEFEKRKAHLYWAAGTSFPATPNQPN